MLEPRLWATRPAHQNAQWHDSLAELGYPVVDLPLMMIEPVHEPAEVQAVKNLILDFDQFHKVIFVSQNAVRETFAWLRDYWPQLPAGVEYFAVGRKTAEAVAAERLTVVANGIQAMDSDELLALPQLQNVWGEKILICRGRGGLPRLGEVLHERGAIVRYCELYHRRLPPTAAAEAAPLIGGCAADVIPIFSGETLQNLVRVFDINGVDERGMTLVVPGKRVTQTAEKLGFRHVVTAENATATTMLAAVRAALDQRAQTL